MLYVDFKKTTLYITILFLIYAHIACQIPMSHVTIFFVAKAHVAMTAGGGVSHVIRSI